MPEWRHAPAKTRHFPHDSSRAAYDGRHVWSMAAPVSGAGGQPLATAYARTADELARSAVVLVESARPARPQSSSRRAVTHRHDAALPAQVARVDIRGTLPRRC